jgi:hypothetical protein
VSECGLEASIMTSQGLLVVVVPGVGGGGICRQKVSSRGTEQTVS